MLRVSRFEALQIRVAKQNTPTAVAKKQTKNSRLGHQPRRWTCELGDAGPFGGPPRSPVDKVQLLDHVCRKPWQMPLNEDLSAS